MFNPIDNSRRADAARAAVHAFCDVIRTDRDDAIVDLIADLLHLARRDGWENPSTALDTALMHFEAEEREEDGD